MFAYEELSVRRCHGYSCSVVKILNDRLRTSSLVTRFNV